MRALGKWRDSWNIEVRNFTTHKSNHASDSESETGKEKLGRMGLWLIRLSKTDHVRKIGEGSNFSGLMFPICTTMKDYSEQGLESPTLKYSRNAFER
jgi:hypothetical protein